MMKTRLGGIGNEQQLLEQAREEFAPSFLAREELKIILGR